MNQDEHTSSETTIIVSASAVPLGADDFDHAAWDAAQSVTLARYWSGAEAPAARRAEARLLCCDAALCVRFVCRVGEPLIVSEEARLDVKTIGLWDRDVCEMFVAPGADDPTIYYEFEAAPTGEWLDLRLDWSTNKRETDWEYHSGMTAGARITSGETTTIICVPWRAFGRAGAPAAGERWRANLFRCVGDGATRGYIAWRPTLTPAPDYHVPRVFGTLLFA